MHNRTEIKIWIILFMLSCVGVVSCRPCGLGDKTRDEARLVNVLIPTEHELRERSVGSHGTVPAVIVQNTDKLSAEARGVPRYRGVYKQTRAPSSSYSRRKPPVVAEKSKHELGSGIRTMPTVGYRPFHEASTKLVHKSILTNGNSRINHIVEPAKRIVGSGFPKWTQIPRKIQNKIQNINQKTALLPSKHSNGAAAEELTVPPELAEDEERLPGPEGYAIPEIEENTPEDNSRGTHYYKTCSNAKKLAMQAKNREADDGPYYENEEALGNWNPDNPTLPQAHITRSSFMTNSGIQWIPSYRPIPKSVGIAQNDDMTDNMEYSPPLSTANEYNDMNTANEYSEMNAANEYSEMNKANEYGDMNIVSEYDGLHYNADDLKKYIADVVSVKIDKLFEDQQNIPVSNVCRHTSNTYRPMTPCQRAVLKDKYASSRKRNHGEYLQWYRPV